MLMVVVVVVVVMVVARRLPFWQWLRSSCDGAMRYYCVKKLPTLLEVLCLLLGGFKLRLNWTTSATT
jgi:branched-subunit amino acid transport protein AzlD